MNIICNDARKLLLVSTDSEKKELSKKDGLGPSYQQPCGVGVHVDIVDISTHLVQDVKKLKKKNEEKDDLIKGLIKEVKELKERTMEKEEDVEQEETTGREDVDDFVRASKNSLKLLDLWKQTLRGPEK